MLEKYIWVFSLILMDCCQKFAKAAFPEEVVFGLMVVRVA
jgi:hypothetical protein